MNEIISNRNTRDGLWAVWRSGRAVSHPAVARWLNHG